MLAPGPAICVLHRSEVLEETRRGEHGSRGGSQGAPREGGYPASVVNFGEMLKIWRWFPDRQDSQAPEIVAFRDVPVGIARL